MKRKLRRLKRIIILLLVIALCATLYHSRFIAPNALTVTNHTISYNELPDSFSGFKIGYISDINLSSSDDLTRLQEIIDTINKEEFDMIIFGGDLYETTLFDNQKVIDLLSTINSKYGKFAVLGEKDIQLTTKDILTASGFEVLHNEYRPIYKNGEVIHFYGLENSGDLSLLKTEKMDNQFNFVAVHQPDYYSTLVNYDIQLQLSGHNLGGYINLPLYGEVFKKEGATSHPSTVIDEQDTSLIVSNGLQNESDFDFRFNAPLEIVAITLTK